MIVKGGFIVKDGSGGVGGDIKIFKCPRLDMVPTFKTKNRTVSSLSTNSKGRRFPGIRVDVLGFQLENK